MVFVVGMVLTVATVVVRHLRRRRVDNANTVGLALGGDDNNAENDCDGEMLACRYVKGQPSVTLYELLALLKQRLCLVDGVGVYLQCHVEVSTSRRPASRERRQGQEVKSTTSK